MKTTIKKNDLLNLAFKHMMEDKFFKFFQTLIFNINIEKAVCFITSTVYSMDV